MKKNILSLILSIFVLFLSTSFVSIGEHKTTFPNRIIQQHDWGSWKTTSCFKHLHYRVKKKSYKNEWAIEFRNGYNQSISMSVNIVDGDGGDRFTISAGQNQIRSGYYTNNQNATYINFGVDKVKFGDTSWGGPYAQCD